MAFGLANVLSGALPVIGAFMGGGKGSNPANAGAPYFQRTAAHGQNAYNPFIKRGQEAEDLAYPIYSQMATNPIDHFNSIMGEYNESPYTKYLRERGLRTAHSTAAAGGFAGTPNDVENRVNLVNALSSADMQQFLQNILGIQSGGLEGLENRVGRGFDASGRLADYLGGADLNSAQNAMYGRSYGNQQRNNMFNALGSLVAPGGLFGKGGAFGGR